MESDTNGRMLNARYGVDGLRTKKQDANGNSSREYGAGISTSASTPLTQNSTAPSISYISGPVILGAEINGEFVYHLGDALSTVRDVVDDEGDVIRSFEFDEYGNMLNSSGSGAASPKTWIGGLSVNDDRADSGLWNMGHRNYDGVLGRFLSRDPIGHAGGLNLYAYGANSPVNYSDPEGLLLRDNSGNIIFAQLSSPRLLEHESGRKSYGVDGLIFADNGTPFLVTKNLKGPLTDEAFDTNCHGFSAADGEFWVSPDIILDLLKADGYRQVKVGLPGDIALFYDWIEEGITHSAKVLLSCGDQGLVFGLAGTQTTPWLGTVSPSDYVPMDSHRPSNKVNITYWRKI